MYLCRKFSYFMQKSTIFYLFSTQDSPRLRYTAAFIFEQMLGLPCQIILFDTEKIAEINPEIVDSQVENFLFFIEEKDVEIVEKFLIERFFVEIVIKKNKNEQKSKKLPVIIRNDFVENILFQSTTNHQIDLKVEMINDDFEEKIPCLFHQNNKKSLIDFDIFSAVFFMISRYEEYNPAAKRDQHGRYLAENSVSFRYKFLEKPIVDIWIKIFKNALNDYYPILLFKEEKFDLQPTFDIDIAWCYKHKNWQQTLGRIAKDALNFNFSALKQRFEVVFSNEKASNEKDPFFTFDFIEKCHENANTLPVIYFFLLGKYSKYDKNIDVKNIYFQKLINNLSEKYELGVHPSYGSNESESILKNEIQILENITGKQVLKSRQHFLKLDLPTTYRRLISQNIKEDWTMGYAEYLGFRAGCSQAFYWFDLEKNQATDLLTIPFCIMDVTMRVYLNMSPSEAILAAKKLINSVQKVKGRATVLWHNSSLSEHEEWQNWRDVYTQIISLNN